MNVLIVFAHPEPHSFNGRILAATKAAFDSHQIQVSDLYRMNFNPVGGPGDFTALASSDRFDYQTEQKHAFASSLFEPTLQAQMDKLVWADLLIFQFPLWWFGMPAILKGWVDRVFAYGFAYGGGRVFETGAFRGKRALLCVTVGAPMSAFGDQGRQVEFRTMMRPYWRGMFQFVGMDALEPQVFFRAGSSEEADRIAEIERYQSRLRKIFEEPVLKMTGPGDIEI